MERLPGADGVPLTDEQDRTPGQSVVYLLSGLPGSGKTTYARQLEAQGVARISVDDRMRGRYGRMGVDYPADEQVARLRTILMDVKAAVVGAVEAGRSVVLDHGLGMRAERDIFRQLVEDLGGSVELVHFKADLDELIRRCAARADDPAAVPISEELLRSMYASWEPPVDEGARVVET